MSNLQTQWQNLQGVEYLPATDPLWRNTPLPLRRQYSPLGIPMKVDTNAPLLVERANEVFGHWDRTDVRAGADAVELRLLLHDAGENLPSGAPSPLMRAQESYFLASVGQSLGFADRKSGFAVAYVTPALMAYPDVVRACFVECLGIYLACGRRRVPLHAAGLQWGGRGVLLTGRDGAGKSTLAYACLRAGFQLVAEDIVFAPEPQVREDITVWGDSRFLHLLPDAPRLFPELRDAPTVRQLNGELKLRVRVRDMDSQAPLTRMPVWGVCSLGRSADSMTHLQTPDPAAMRQALTHFKGDPPLDAAGQQVAAERLLHCHMAHLEVGSDLERAVAVLKRWLEA
jgi:hypothetical protein